MRPTKRNLRRALEESNPQNEDEFEVEAILGLKQDKNGEKVYEVKWKGDQETTWEPESNLANATKLIASFHRRKQNNSTFVRERRNNQKSSKTKKSKKKKKKLMTTTNGW